MRSRAPSAAALSWVDWRGHVRMEDLTADPDPLVDLLATLTGGALTPTDRWLADVAALGEVNRHRRDDGRATAAARHAALPVWRREVLDHFLVLHDLVGDYTRLGYELGFVSSDQPFGGLVLPDARLAARRGGVHARRVAPRP